MNNNYEFKKNDIRNCACYYLDDIMRVEGIDFDNILLDEKSYENILTHDISYKTFMGAKTFILIRFDKVDGIIKIYNGTRYLELLGPRIYNAIYDKINYLISEKIDAKYIINHNFARIKIQNIF